MGTHTHRNRHTHTHAHSPTASNTTAHIAMHAEAEAERRELVTFYEICHTRISDIAVDAYTATGLWSILTLPSVLTCSQTLCVCVCVCVCVCLWITYLCDATVPVPSVRERKRLVCVCLSLSLCGLLKCFSKHYLFIYIVQKNAKKLIKNFVVSILVYFQYQGQSF